MKEKIFRAIENIDEKTAKQLNILSLAYIGDTVYDLYIRSYLVKSEAGMVNKLNEMAAKTVNAAAQSKAYELLKEMFTQEEDDIFHRGRNAKSSVPKNMTVRDYRNATGLEAVIGYLYLTGQTQRLNAFFEIILNEFMR